MKIEWAILCESIDVAKGGGKATVRGVGGDGVSTPQLPVNVSVLVAIKVIAQPWEVEAGKPHRLTARVIGPELEETGEEGEEVLVRPGRLHEKGIDSFTILQRKQNFSAFAEGDYSILFTIDKSTVGVSLYVEKSSTDS